MEDGRQVEVVNSWHQATVQLAWVCCSTAGAPQEAVFAPGQRTLVSNVPMRAPPPHLA